MRLGNARTIADIEFVIDEPSLGSEQDSWYVNGVECSRSRHRFLGAEYSFAFDVVRLRFESKKQRSWHIVIVGEVWQFKKMKGRPRGTKQLKIVKGNSADILSWIRQSRDKKLEKQTAAPQRLKTGSRAS